MVLFKRKPVQILQTPNVQDESTEVTFSFYTWGTSTTNREPKTNAAPQVWHIPQTGEIFTSYEDYLNRMDFYAQPRFICQITGHSGLNFFSALTSEVCSVPAQFSTQTGKSWDTRLGPSNRVEQQAGAQEVDQAFPEAIKGPVLRRIQFQTLSRIDHLVDMIYEEFKDDYYPGEPVTIHLMNGERVTGVVRDKTRFGSRLAPDGTLIPPYIRYIASIDGRPDEEAVVDDKHCHRDKKAFTKSVIRSFIKKTVTREAWNGAPWLVKHDVAQQYHIDTRVPPHLRYDMKLLERKQNQAQKKAHNPNHWPEMTNGNGSSVVNLGPARLPELKPAPKSHTTKAPKHSHGHPPPEMPLLPPTKGNRQGVSPCRSGPTCRRRRLRSSSRPNRRPPPPPPKYPIEDLQLEPRDDYVRPALKFLCNDPPEGIVDSGARNDKILMKSIGPLLETWDTLNVYCEIFKLDSFTFDDFVEAMEVASDETPCELFTEVHCAVLKHIVSSEADGGKVQVNLPELDEDEEDEEDDEDESAAPSPEPEPEPEPKRSGRTTRRSLAQAEAERIQAEAAAAEKEKEKEAEPAVKHRAPEALADFDWVEHLKNRDFQDGGWQLIMVGLLHQLSKEPRETEICEELLSHLVPPDVEEPSRDTVREHYGNLDLNLRIQALQIICMLTIQTKAVRQYMEECAETMTTYRKEKIDWQRKRKQAIEDLKPLNDQRKILLPDNMPKPEEEVKTNGDVKMVDVEESAAEPSEEAVDSDDDAHGRRSLRRGGDRAAERQRKREAEEAKKKKEAELAAKMPKQSKQFIKVTKDIQKKEDYIKQCEEEIATLDNDLREADCGRTRVLGKDRFWNRYYWFERNGMPYGGLPNSSTAEAAYANGCIWVQGPDEIEREGYIDLPVDLQAEYKAQFKVTVPQRKKMEEGRTSVFNAHQWGYYSDPGDVDQLLNWLDPRGYNELKLRKEIMAFKDKIVANMESRVKYLGPPPEEKETEKEEPPPKESKRMSTRAKNQPSPEPVAFRCQNWTNTMAIEELGHLHSELPPPPAPKKGKGSRKSRG
ncbi:hypothetical protein PG993_009744 [Apiospora rasikravindrae]|uniref:Uncharacterized protein n=1 Tax=Apiospora rasikravindrae TaxID=990691 RepID=A0ABR1SKF6_9PEZI